MGRLVRQTTPTESARILFTGSGYAFAKETLTRLAEGKPVRADKQEFVERFLGNALLMSTHYSWGAQGWGTPQFALLAYKNPELQETLRQMMPFERKDMPDRIKAHWPARVAGLFSDLAGAPAQQKKLEKLARAHRTQGDVYRSIAMYLGETDKAGQEMVWGRLMHARFRLVDQLLPKPDLSPARAGELLAVWNRSRMPSTEPVDEMGVRLFRMRAASPAPALS